MWINERFEGRWTDLRPWTVVHPYSRLKYRLHVLKDIDEGDIAI